jgi:hypothetical protein
MPLSTFYFAYQKHEQDSEKAGQGGEDAQSVSLFAMLGFDRPE